MPIDKIIFDLGGIVVPEKWNHILEEMAKFTQVDTSVIDNLTSKLRPQLIRGEISLLDLYYQLLTDRNDITLQKVLEHHIALHKSVATERDPQIMDLIKNLRNNDYTVACATNTEREIADYVKRSQDPIFSHFDYAFISTDLRLSKDTPEFYKKVAAHLKASPKQTLTVDNMRGCFNAARSAGLNAILYGQFKEGYHQLLIELRSFGIRI